MGICKQEGNIFMLCIICFVVTALGGTESKRARLVDGETPYEGRVEIYHGNEWLPVLYYSPGASQHDWSLVSADVVCKESGYPGAMWHGKDDFALRNDERRRVYNVFCVGPKENLDDCTYETGEYNSLNSAAATAVCQYDDYVGCHRDGTGTLQPYTTSDQMTIQLCLQLCRSFPDNDYMYVGLQAGDECYCITEEQYHSLRSVSTTCNLHCSGDRSQACGGTNGIGVYRSIMGACGGQFHVSGTIYSNRFPGYYPENTRCTWDITANTGSILRLKFIIDEIDWVNDEIAFIEMHDGKYNELDIKNAAMVSCSNFVRFTFVSSASNHLGRFAVAFQAVTSNCQAPTNLENGNFYYNDSCPYFDGDTITFTCKEGYTLTSPHSKIECREDGAWNDTLPVCTDSAFHPGVSTTLFATTDYHRKSTTVEMRTATPKNTTSTYFVDVGTVTGAVIGVIILMVLILLVSIMIYRRKSTSQKRTETEVSYTTGGDYDDTEPYTSSNVIENINCDIQNYEEVSDAVKGDNQVRVNSVEAAERRPFDYENDSFDSQEGNADIGIHDVDGNKADDLTYEKLAQQPGRDLYMGLVKPDKTDLTSDATSAQSDLNVSSTYEPIHPSLRADNTYCSLQNYSASDNN
ncbi:uncharacterized protein [Ptychodera flava]|uniref:uncharacterized protein n=1 Tax=Ptychodera flava TaxID=63121 RepID=UPI00396A4436